MRTKGILTRIGGTLWNEAPSGTRKISATETDNGYGPYRVDTVEQAADNAAHLADCWNAVESIGGDPARVGELVAVVRALSGIGNPAAGDPGHVDYQDAMEHARALLAKIDGAK